jgi:hypothetical protein
MKLLQCLLIALVLALVPGVFSYAPLAGDYSDAQMSITKTGGEELPDLAVLSVRAANVAYLGRTFSVTYEVENIGDADSGAFNMGIYLSLDASFNSAEDLLLRLKSSWPAGLAAKQKSKATAKAVIPTDTELGKYYLIVVADPEHNVSETTLDNNIAVKIELTKVFRYLDKGDGTVTDGKTGLVWQKTDDLKERTWPHARSYCENMILGGHNDWRLPRIDELQTIIDNYKYNPAINSVFIGKPRKPIGFWGDTTYAYWKDSAWFIWFFNGDTYTDPKNIGHFTRCVRGESNWSADPSGRLTKVDEYTIKDNLSTLVWQRSDDMEMRTWQDANAYCESLILGGESDWRLPYIEELYSIINYLKYDPALNDELFDGHSGYYWSKSISPDNPAKAREIVFTNGSVRSNLQSVCRYARCVRNAR